LKKKIQKDKTGAGEDTGDKEATEERSMIQKILKILRGKRKSKRRNWKRQKQNVLPNTKKIEKNDKHNSIQQNHKRRMKKVKLLLMKLLRKRKDN